MPLYPPADHQGSASPEKPSAPIPGCGQDERVAAPGGLRPGCRPSPLDTPPASHTPRPSGSGGSSTAAGGGTSTPPGGTAVTQPG